MILKISEIKKINKNFYKISYEFNQSFSIRILGRVDHRKKHNDGNSIESPTNIGLYSYSTLTFRVRKDFLDIKVVTIIEESRFFFLLS